MSIPQTGREYGRLAEAGWHDRPTPRSAWVWALVLALLGSVAAAIPIAGVGLVLVAGIVATLGYILRNPYMGVVALLAFLPFYPASRAIFLILNFPAAPLQLFGMWSELILATAVTGLLVQSSVHRRRLRVYWFDVPVWILIAMVFYAGILSYTENQYVSIIYGIHSCLPPLGFYLLVRWTVTSRARGEQLLRVWLLTFSILCVISLYEYFIKPPVFVNMVEAMRPGMSTGYSPDWYWHWYPRMYSLLYTEQPWGTLCSMVLLYYFGAISYTTPERRLRFHGVAFLAFLGLIFSMSRGGFLFLGVGVLLLLLLPGKHRASLVAGVAILAILGSVMLVFFAADSRVAIITQRMAAFGDQSDALHTSRQSQIDVAIQTFLIMPSGRGLGRGGSAFLHEGDGLGAVTDSGYFNQLAEQGIVGMIGLAIAICLQFGILIQMYWGGAERNRGMTAAVIAMLGGMVAQNIGGNMFQMYFIAPLFWVLVAIVTSRQIADGVRSLREVRIHPFLASLPIAPKEGDDKESLEPVRLPAP